MKLPWQRRTLKDVHREQRKRDLVHIQELVIGIHQEANQTWGDEPIAISAGIPISEDQYAELERLFRIGPQDG